VVEDRETDFDFVRMLLSRSPIHHYELDRASNYEEGLEAASRCGYDIGIFDFNLGGLTGVDLLQELGARGVRLPVILLTGDDDPSVDRAASESGAADFLCKSTVDAARLERSVRYALKHAEVLAELRIASRLLVNISEEEKRRIGGELHDGLGQHLTGVACLAAALRDQLRSESSAHADRANQIAGLVNSAIEIARMCARGLCPVKMEQSGLQAALEDLAHHVRQVHRIDCRFENDGLPIEPDPESALHLYRIAQEAVTNATRHGGAGIVLIRLDAGGQFPSLTVADNGCGFDPDAPREGAGIGLRLMQQRAAMLGGSFEIQTLSERGIRIRCHFPRGRPDEG